MNRRVVSGHTQIVCVTKKLQYRGNEFVMKSCQSQTTVEDAGE